MTRPREVTSKRSPRRTLAMCSGSFRLTCFMRASCVQMKGTYGKAAHQVSGTEDAARDVQAAGVRVGLVRPNAQRRLPALSTSPEKRILMREKACRKTERGKNDRCTESTVRSVAAAREHGGPVHSAWSLPQGHGVRDGGGGEVFRVPRTAGLVRLGRHDLRDARRTGAHLRSLYAMGCGLSRGSPALRGLSGPHRQRVDVHRQGRRLRVSAVLGDRLLRARARGRRRVCVEDEGSRLNPERLSAEELKRLRAEFDRGKEAARAVRGTTLIAWRGPAAVR